MNKKLIVLTSSLVLSVCLLAGTAWGLGSSNTVKATDALNLEKGTIVSNVFFKSESLSGLTVEEAVEVAEGPIQKILTCTYRMRGSSDKTQNVVASAKDLGIGYDNSSCSEIVEKAVLSGSLMTRYKMAKDYQAKPVSINPEITVSESTIENFFSPYLTKWEMTPLDAVVSCTKDGVVEVEKGHNGYSYEFGDSISQLVDDIKNYRIDDEVYEIELTVAETKADLTNERAEAFTIIGEFTTSYAAPTTQVLANREQNLDTSTSNMNGYRFAPGETASALTMYGDVSYDNGYLPAGTFIDGAHSDELGGGICQTTTTLYNAVLYAELEVAYRNHHSMLVTYVSPSRDAMVYAQEKNDFKFVNSSSDYIFINSFIDKTNHTLTVRIIGHEDHDATHSVEYESEVLTYKLPTINVIYDDKLPIGWTDQEKYTTNGETPTCGITSRLWKLTTDNGVTTKTLFSKSNDTYKPANSLVITMSKDMTYEAESTEDYSNGFLFISLVYLDGTGLGSDPNTWTGDEIVAFNEEMAKLAKANNFEWSDTGAVVTRTDKDGKLYTWVDKSDQVTPTTSGNESTSASTPTTTQATN